MVLFFQRSGILLFRPRKKKLADVDIPLLVANEMGDDKVGTTVTRTLSMSSIYKLFPFFLYFLNSCYLILAISYAQERDKEMSLPEKWFMSN